MFSVYFRTEFSTAAFRFGHSLVRQTFSLPDDGNSDIGDMFKSFQMISNQGNILNQPNSYCTIIFTEFVYCPLSVASIKRSSLSMAVGICVESGHLGL